MFFFNDYISNKLASNILILGYGLDEKSNKHSVSQGFRGMEGFVPGRISFYSGVVSAAFLHNLNHSIN